MNVLMCSTIFSRQGAIKSRTSSKVMSISIGSPLVALRPCTRNTRLSGTDCIIAILRSSAVRLPTRRTHPLPQTLLDGGVKRVAGDTDAVARDDFPADDNHGIAGSAADIHGPCSTARPAARDRDRSPRRTVRTRHAPAAHPRQSPHPSPRLSPSAWCSTERRTITVGPRNFGETSCTFLKIYSNSCSVTS